MATAVLRDNYSEVTSSAGQANGPAIRAGGNDLVVQFVGPDALGGLEGSMDKLNWAVLDDEAGAPIELKDNAIIHLRHSSKWVRHFVAIDAGQPQTFSAIIGIIKESL